MKGDFSRFSFQGSDDYESVLQQQGRVQTDADWNEQARLTASRLRISASDIVGEHGGPDGRLGFAVEPDGGSLRITAAGSYYVDGLLCRSEAEAAPHAGAAFNADRDSLGAQEGWVVIYLRAWRQLTTALDDPELIEPAFGGAETSARVKITTELRATPSGETNRSLSLTQAELFAEGWTGPPESKGAPPKATASVQTSSNRGNQLLRVEVHRVDAGARGDSVIKWSLDNGSVVAPVARYEGPSSTSSLATLQLNLHGRPAHTRFAVGDLVEVLTQRDEQLERPGVLAEIEAIQDATLTVRAVDGTLRSDIAQREAPRVRRWRGMYALSEASDPDKPLMLDDLLALHFTFETGDVQLMAGQFWTFPLRQRSERSGRAVARPPDGPRVHYAPVALAWWTGAAFQTVHDVRKRFSPLTRLKGLDVNGTEAMVGPLTVHAMTRLHGGVNVKGVDLLPIHVAAQVGDSGYVRVHIGDSFSFDEGRSGALMVALSRETLEPVVGPVFVPWTPTTGVLPEGNAAARREALTTVTGVMSRSTDGSWDTNTLDLAAHNQHLTDVSDFWAALDEGMLVVLAGSLAGLIALRGERAEGAAALRSLGATTPSVYDSLERTDCITLVSHLGAGPGSAIEQVRDHDGTQTSQAVSTFGQLMRSVSDARWTPARAARGGEVFTNQDVQVAKLTATQAASFGASLSVSGDLSSASSAGYLNITSPIRVKEGRVGSYSGALRLETGGTTQATLDTNGVLSVNSGLRVGGTDVMGAIGSLRTDLSGLTSAVNAPKLYRIWVAGCEGRAQLPYDKFYYGHGHMTCTIGGSRGLRICFSVPAPELVGTGQTLVLRKVYSRIGWSGMGSLKMEYSINGRTNYTVWSSSSKSQTWVPISSGDITSNNGIDQGVCVSFEVSTLASGGQLSIIGVGCDFRS